MHRWHAAGGTDPTKGPFQDCGPQCLHSNLVPAGRAGARRQCSTRSRREAAVRQELALNRAPCFHFSPVAMGWAWRGQQPPYIGQSRNPGPLLQMLRQWTRKRQKKQLPFRGKHLSAILLFRFSLVRMHEHTCAVNSKPKQARWPPSETASGHCTLLGKFLASPGLSFPIWI